MKKLAIVSIVLLLAGIGMAFGQEGSCICPNSASCSQSGCLENCGGSCALGAASSCATNCPIGNCGSASGSSARCAASTTGCCGK